MKYFLIFYTQQLYWPFQLMFELYNLYIMKRKPSHQIFHPEQISKPTLKRIKSPSLKRLTHKKQQEISSVMFAKHRVNQSREELKGDSNNTTVSAKPKSHKSIKITKQKAEKYEQIDIMSLINLFATKIQRQWRVYSFCKCINERIIQRRSTKQYNSWKTSKEMKLQLDQNKIKKMAKFEEQEQSEENQYDRLKYKQLSPAKSKKKAIKYKVDPPLSNSSKETSKISADSKSYSITPRCRVQQQKPPSKTPKESVKSSKSVSKSLEKGQSAENILQYTKEREERRASFNSVEIRKITQNRRHSTGDLNAPPIQRNQLKIDKAYELRIEQEEKPKPSQTSLLSSRKIQRIENEGAIAFGKVPLLDEFKSRYKKQLKLQKFKQLISIQNRYKKKEVTYRSYLDLVGKIKQQHSTKLHQIKQKEVQLKNTWNQLLQLYKLSPQQHKFAEDQHQNTSHLDVSVSFERWDFNSSAKKSIDAFDFPETGGSKVLSIESVLRELEEEDEQEKVSKANQEEKPFKKNKSLKAVEIIDQRSKEISEKDSQCVQQTPERKSAQVMPIVVQSQSPKKLRTELSQKDQQKIKFFQQQQQEQEQNQYANQQSSQANDKQISLQLQIDSKTNIEQQLINVQITPYNKRNQQNSASQSLLITPASNTNHNIILASEQQIQAENDKKLQATEDMNSSNNNTQTKLDELLFREVHSPVEQIQQMHPLVVKFRELVIERIVMTNIKIMSSIKYVCARAGEEKRRQIAAKNFLHPIDTDINAINTWLLQISHFVLDNYTSLIRQNLAEVKQPPEKEVLAMARKGLDIIPIYQTIPQYAFKDFQFHYIKTLANNHGITIQNYDKFSSLTYTFHRSLIDSLNTALMEELATGKDWVKTPWPVPRTYKASRPSQDQAKLSLQKSINLVSNLAEYNLGKLYRDEQISEIDHKQYEQQKLSLVCRQQVQDISLCYFFSIGYILLSLASSIIEQQLALAAIQILSLRS